MENSDGPFLLHAVFPPLLQSQGHEQAQKGGKKMFAKVLKFFRDMGMKHESSLW